MQHFIDMLIGPTANLLRTLVVGVLAYVSLVLVLRVSGKRTLSKLNAFDLVVTVALGSCLATVLLSKDSSWLQGLTAFVVLIAMQYIVAWLSVRSPRVRRIVKASPTLLYYRGDILEDALRSERLTVDEVYAAMRDSGIASVSSVSAVVLESDGSLSVLEGSTEQTTTLGRDVAGSQRAGG